MDLTPEFKKINMKEKNYAQKVDDVRVGFVAKYIPDQKLEIEKAGENSELEDEEMLSVSSGESSSYDSEDDFCLDEEIIQDI